MPKEIVVPVPESPDPLAGLQEAPIFIVGLARSGTTWIQSIMAQHPLVANVYESTLFDSPRGLAELLGDKHWGPHANGLNTMMTREELAREIRLFASRILARRVWPGHRFLVEKSPGHLLQVRLIGEIFPDARFIHILRDGRDVFASVRAARRSWARGWSRRRFSLPAVARRWRSAVRHMAREKSVLGDRLLEIRYEEMRRDPFAAYRAIFGFCRIPFDEDLLQRIHEATDFETRHTPDENAFFRGGRVGDWRTHFNMLDGLVFNAFAGDSLVEAGYERNRRWFAPMRRKVRPPRARRSVLVRSPSQQTGAEEQP